jgi:KUP system potassium uptake protein
MKLSYFPQIELIHTSKKFHHQVYVPVANWILMIGTIIVTAVYNNVSGGATLFPFVPGCRSAHRAT